jgi:peptidoglycan/LPS O-acetylase OafA/YrhL
MKMAEMLDRRNNNFTLLRLIAACAVIIGHAYRLTGDSSSTDPIAAILGFDYSGSLAVKFFFFLSGLVVTNSLLENPSLSRFLTARAFRVIPALVVVVVLVTFVVGPLYTQLTVSQYFSDPVTFKYLLYNATLRPRFDLPGVFLSNPFHSPNGSLWTLPVEFQCYLALAVLGAIGLYRNRTLMTCILIGIGAWLLHDPSATDRFHTPRELTDANLFFIVGALLATWKSEIGVDARFAAGVALAAYVFRDTEVFRYLVEMLIFSIALCVSSLPTVISMKLPGDFSYGVYLIAFPVQQMLHASLPQMNAQYNQVAVIVLSISYGVVSWILIEKPAILFGKRITEAKTFRLAFRAIKRNITVTDASLQRSLEAYRLRARYGRSNEP